MYLVLSKKLSFIGCTIVLCTDIKAIGLPIVFVFIFFAFSRAAPAAYGDSQARGLIRAAAAGLHQSHSNTGSELHLRPTQQHRILNPLSEARYQTHNLLVPSQIH